MDKYDVGGVVGKGSFGVVVLVTRRSDGAQFVMKRLPISNVTEKEMEAYQNEIRLLSELEHPGIVGYMESFVDRASMDLCIVMQWCSGGDLTSFLKTQATKAKTKLSEAEIMHHFVQMALALHFMHEKNILHRDLKSGNIFLRDHNGTKSIQLGDFGISKVLNGASDLAQTCIGTPYYMSPELFKNKSYNHKSDVWALGCILYELTSLKHAFDAQNINGLANKVIHGIYPPIATSYSKDLRELIKSMLGVTPSSRPSIKQILLMPALFKPLRKYIRHVAAEAAGDYSATDASSSNSASSSSSDELASCGSSYRPSHVLNLKNQLDRIGAPLSGLFAAVDRERAEKRASGKTDSVDATPPPPMREAHARRPRKTAAAAAAPTASDLYDDDDAASNSAIDRTLVAPSSSSSHQSDSHPPTVRRRRADGSERRDRGAAVGKPSRQAALDLAREHAARVEELRQEEAAKAKLEKDFARLQALQEQRAKRLQQRKQQAGRAGGGDASTASTSKDSSTASAGSSGGSSALPIISAVPPSVHSPPPPLHGNVVHSPPAVPTSPPFLPGVGGVSFPSLPNPGAGPASSRDTSRNASPSLNPARIKAKPPTFSLATVQRSASPAAASAAPFLPTAPNGGNNSGAAGGISPPASHASSPRVGGGIPRRINPTAASAVGIPSVQQQVTSPTAETDKESSPIAITSTASGPADGLKLLKRKVAGARQIPTTDGLALPPAVSTNSSAVNSAAGSPELGSFGGGVNPNGVAVNGRRGRPRTNKLPFPGASLPAPSPSLPPPSGDIESTLLHEKEELDRLRIERLRLEELLTRMDEEAGLFENAQIGSAAQPSPRNSEQNRQLQVKVKSPISGSSATDDTSPHPFGGHSPASFSASTVLPAAFDAPLQYKVRDRSTLAPGSSSSSSGAASGPIAAKALRRHSSTGANTNLNHDSLSPLSGGGNGSGAPPLAIPARPRAGNASAASGASPAASTRDRILAAKQAKKVEESSVEQARLMQARKDYFTDRLKAEQRTRDFYGQGPTSTQVQPVEEPALKILLQAQPQYGLSASPTASDDGNLLIYDDSSLAAHLNSDLLPSSHLHPSSSPAYAHSSSLQAEEDELSASSLEVEEFHHHLRQYTRRIENLRSVIEVTSAQGQRPMRKMMQDAVARGAGAGAGNTDDTEQDLASGSEYSSDSDDYSSNDDDDDRRRSPDVESPQPVVPHSLESRKKALAKECVALVGSAIFVKAYDYLAAIQSDPTYADDVDDERKLEQLTSIMGADRVKHWRLIDQLLFVESC